jgi:hypothetical protein
MLRVGAPLIPAIVLLLSIAHLAPLYYKTYLDEGSGFEPGGPHGMFRIPEGLPLREFKQVHSQYMLLASGDRVSFDAVVAATNVRYVWFMELEVLDAIRGERWNFSREYYAPRAPTPEFIAPRDGLYKFLVRVTFKPLEDVARGNVTVDIAIAVSGKLSTRSDVRDRILMELLAVILVVLALVLLSRRFSTYNPYKGFPGLVLWEVKSFYLWLLAPIVAFMYTLFSLNTKPSAGSPSVMLSPVFVTNSIEILVPYTILVVTAVAVVFSYKVEGGYDKPVDILPRSRISVFTAKLTSVLLVTYVPLIVCALNIYIVWLDEILLGAPLMLVEMLGYYTIFTLTLLGVLIATPMIVGSLMPRFVPVMLIGIMVPLLLIIDNPVKASLGFDLGQAVALADNPLIYHYRELPVSRGAPQAMEIVDVSKPYTWFITRGLLVALVALSLSLISHLRREYT